MEIKKNLTKVWNFLSPKPSLSNKKAFVFSLDVIIAVTVVMSVLIVSMFYITKAGDESISTLQTIRIGSDILAVLDYDGTLDTLSALNIEEKLDVILPINYHMKIKIDCINQDPIIAETTDTLPTNRLIASGKRVFVTNTGEYCIADFNIWLK